MPHKRLKAAHMCRQVLCFMCLFVQMGFVCLYWSAHAGFQVLLYGCFLRIRPWRLSDSGREVYKLISQSYRCRWSRPQMEGKREICLCGGSACCQKIMNVIAAAQVCAHSRSSQCLEVIVSNTLSLWLNCMAVIRTMCRPLHYLECPLYSSSYRGEAHTCVFAPSSSLAAVSCKAPCFYGI